MKQSKLRKRRVWRYAVLYFLLLVLFVALLAGPIVAGKKVLKPDLIKQIPQQLFQPIGLNNNDTRYRNETGTNPAAQASETQTGATTSESGAARIKLF